MNNENNISLKSLQNLEVAPPAFLLQNIKGKIADSDVIDLRNTFAPLYNHSAIPAGISFEQIMRKIKATEPINVFTRLQSYQQDPSISFAKIMERLKELGYFKTNTSAKIISFGFIKKLVAAAAVIAFLIGGYFILNKTTSKADGAGMVSTNSTSSTPSTITPNTNVIDLPVVEDSVPKSANIVQTKTLKAIPQEIVKNSFLPKTFKKVYSKNYKNNNSKSSTPKLETITINGENFTILENDYLATFASFTPDKLPAFLQVENPVETQITVDKYSYFNISDAMGGMMKKMYATKSTGAPTRSAKRQKQKLENWKKADSAYFVPNANLNPLDPRDLGNLILNK